MEVRFVWNEMKQLPLGQCTSRRRFDEVTNKCKVTDVCGYNTNEGFDEVANNNVLA